VTRRPDAGPPRAADTARPDAGPPRAADTARPNAGPPRAAGTARSDAGPPRGGLRRALLLAGGPLVALAALAGAFVASDLPDPMATHWDIGGDADGHTPLGVFAAAVIAGWAVGAALPLVQARRRGAFRLTAAPFGWAIQWLAAGLGLVTVVVNDGAATWSAADGVTLLVALVPLAVAGLAALAAHALEHGRPYGPAAAAGERPTVGLRDGEQAAWAGHLRSRPVIAAAIVVPTTLALAALLVGGDATWPLWAAAVVALVAIGAVSELQVTVGASGLTVALGPFGVPRRHWPLADIAWAERIDVDPWRWGGWGWRVLPHRNATAIVIRAGDGLRIGLRDGRELVVTVPDATTAAGLLNDLATRDHPPAPTPAIR
jgi:hypothetical protein